MKGKGDVKPRRRATAADKRWPRVDIGQRRWWISLVCAILICITVWSSRFRTAKIRVQLPSVSVPTTLTSLLAIGPDRLPDLDIAVVNLLVAEGLPGADRIDTSLMLTTLDRWAATIRFETDRHLYKFRRNSGDYNYSEAYFRILMLVTVLQQDMKAHYNLARASNPDFRNSRDLFIHGLINDDNGGTCASMPVLYVAIGRRLGYPLKLVLAKAHLFARWDGGNDRFNIEATNHGLTTPDDEYYKTWPLPISSAEAPYYLRSMAPADEVAAFMALRGDCLDANGDPAGAATAYAEACRLAPAMMPYRTALNASAAGREP